MSKSPETLQIEKLVYGGNGLGRLHSGEVIFVPYSIPGETVNVQPDANAKKPLSGTISSILEISSERVAPRCSVFEICGGCQWQQLSLEAQRYWKRAIVQESLSRLGGLPDAPILETLGNEAWQYRNRVQWEIQNKNGHYQLGYQQAKSHDVVAFETCWIIPESLNRLANWLQHYFKEHPNTASTLQRIEVMENAKQELLLSVYGQADATLVSALTEAFPKILGILQFPPKQKYSQPQQLFGASYLTETVLEQTYHISANSFFQTNRAATASILHTLEEWMLPNPNTLLDLYSGVGLFSFYFQYKSSKIIAVENAGSAVQDAQENAKQQGLSHIEWHAGDAIKILSALKRDVDVAIVDPPRAGCPPEVLQWLNQHVQQQILYVSCNPTTLARDLKQLVTSGWRVQAVQPIDMFPQTYHVETVVNLRRE